MRKKKDLKRLQRAGDIRNQNEQKNMKKVIPYDYDKGRLRTAKRNRDRQMLNNP